jgi:hypothetical protein
MKLNAEERTTVLEAVEEWASHHPFPDDPVISFAGGVRLTPRELAKEVANNTPVGERVLSVIAFGIHRSSLEEVLASFQQKTTAV